MESRITHTSYVINFLDEGFDSDKISAILKTETDLILNSMDLSKFPDWELVINALYTNTDSILVFKNSKAYVDEKYKEIVVHIPMPSVSNVSWGVTSDQRIKVGSVPNISKYADELTINWSQYDNRQDFILDSIRRAINHCFDAGFKINGSEIIRKDIDAKGLC